jgi:hypothetical protein
MAVLIITVRGRQVSQVVIDIVVRFTFSTLETLAEKTILGTIGTTATVEYREVTSILDPRVAQTEYRVLGIHRIILVYGSAIGARLKTTGLDIGPTTLEIDVYKFFNLAPTKPSSFRIVQV